MSCIATFYLLDATKRESAVEAHRNEKREVPPGIWPFRRSKMIGDQYLWEFLDGICIQKDDLPYSGFCVTTYLFTFLGLEHDTYFEVIDANNSFLTHEGATKLVSYLTAHPPVHGRLEEFRRGEDPSIGSEELAHDLEAFDATHSAIAQWGIAVTKDHIGVLFLSF